MQIIALVIFNIFVAYILKTVIVSKINKDAQISSKIVLSHPRFYGYISYFCIILYTAIYVYPAYLINLPPIYLWSVNICFISVIAYLSYRFLVRSFNALYYWDGIIRTCFLVTSLFAVLATLGIIAIVLANSIDFFKIVSPLKFLFGNHWFPEDGGEESFGIVTLFKGTMYVVFLTIIIAIPLSLMSAIRIFFFSEHPQIMKSIFDTMSSIPSIVYGFIAIVVISPLITETAKSLGIRAESENTISAVIAVTMMILPFLISMSIEVFKSFPKTFIDASLALGLSKQETVRQIIVPACIPNLLAIYIIAITRIIGETMIVAMSLGMNSSFSLNPLKSVTTFTIQIVASVTGDSDFTSPVFLSAFAISIVLICFTSILNYISFQVVHKFGHKYVL